MKPEGIMLSKISQIEKDKQYVISHMWILKDKINNIKTNPQTQKATWWLPEVRGLEDWVKEAKGL